LLRKIYTVVFYSLIPLVLLRLAWRGLRNRGYLQRIPERFGFVSSSSAKKVIWLHAVSVGEARATPSLVEALRTIYKYHGVLITTMTPTGSDQVYSLYGDTVDHCYVPYDIGVAVDRFLDKKKPAIAIIMETEIWPNLYIYCQRRSIPIVIVNARLSSASTKGYKKILPLVRQTLSSVNRIGAQSRVDAENFLSIGASNEQIEVTGSIKFEFELSASLSEAADSLRHQWGNNRMVWLAASTHEGEEDFVLAAYRELKHQFPELLLVLVPRHPERFASVARLSRKTGFGVASRSENQGPLPEDVDILIGDTMGELQLFYAAATVAFVGGSLVNTGGHNILEPAAVGTPIVFGPYMFNFREIGAMALECGAAEQIQSPLQLAETVKDYLSNPNKRHDAGEAGKRMVKDNRGALECTMKIITGVLPPD